jgi:predicted protein tyrosine phosphatase
MAEKIKIISYPKRIFDHMVNSGTYEPGDLFISIGYTFAVEDGEDDPVLPAGERTLRVNFDDVVEDAVFPSVGGSETKVFAIRPEQARSILEFGMLAQPGATVHVHCFAGQSRSAGVAVALAEAYEEHGREFDLWHTKVYTSPNQTVLNLMRAALRDGLLEGWRWRCARGIGT